MPLATITDVINLGFSAQQFGNQPDFETENSGFVAQILSDVARLVRAEVGSSTYDDADDAGTDSQQLKYTYLSLAEKHLAAAELWRRVEAFERRDKITGREGSGAETIGSRALANAEKFEALAWAEVTRVTGTSRAGGISVGRVETGPYSQVGA